ncbi:MAG: LruC domain-containing protein [Pseudomonadota bacterium]
MFRPILFVVSLLLTAGAARAESFQHCPAEAFLTQGKPAKLFQIDLTTGAFSELAADLGTRDKLNAIAFSEHDNYLYAWSYGENTIVRIGADYQVMPLVLDNKPQSDFYVGDVAVLENAYYLYRRGSKPQHGLWRIGLDAGAADYLRAERIAAGNSPSLDIYDFAFHPQDGLIYSIDAKGELITMDPTTAEVTWLGNTGISGTLGAIYFDATGYLYAGRNKDGVIFRVNPHDPMPLAEEFAQGPSSSNNDGGRCALAPVIVGSRALVDFGDAPDSYRTSLASNGARHGSPGVRPFLGATVDGESQAAIAPLADEAIGTDDDDGVTFVTALAAGDAAIVQVSAVGEGYLNAWIDFDKNGEFGDGEKVFHQVSIKDETRNLVFDVPRSARAGSTWARFRFSSVKELNAYGGVNDGEVEDYPLEIIGSGATTLFYPSESGYVTLAFEDLWPGVGDYDLNDLVVHYRTSLVIQDGSVVGVGISGQMMAIGATFHNGFGVEVTQVSRNNIDQETIEFVINGEPQPNSPLEAGQSKAVFIMTDDIWNFVTPAEGCAFYRTENGCGESPIQASFSLTARFHTPIDVSQFADQLFNPFIFATEGFTRNSIFTSPPGRGLEIHLKNRTPTDLADPELLGRAEDGSDPAAGLYYQTSQGLPWAIEIGTEWKHPAEYQDLVEAYPEFVEWVQSQGDNKPDWYMATKANKSKLYRQGEE